MNRFDSPPLQRKPKKRDWRDWVLGVIAFATFANGAAELSDMRKLDNLSRQQTEISQCCNGEAQRTAQWAKREEFVSRLTQVKEIKDFLARNGDEIKSLDYYQRQLLDHAQGAIDLGYEALSTRTTEDAETKAIKRLIQRLEELLVSNAQGRKKLTGEDLIELAGNIGQLLESCGYMFLATRRQLLDDETRVV